MGVAFQVVRDQFEFGCFLQRCVIFHQLILIHFREVRDISDSAPATTNQSYKSIIPELPKCSKAGHENVYYILSPELLVDLTVRVNHLPRSLLKLNIVIILCVQSV